jgi:hypothetical protein
MRGAGATCIRTQSNKEEGQKGTKSQESLLRMAIGEDSTGQPRQENLILKTDCLTNGRDGNGESTNENFLAMSTLVIMTFLSVLLIFCLYWLICTKVKL